MAAGEESSPEKPLGVAASSKLIMSNQCAPQQRAKGILARVNSSTGSGMRDFFFTQCLLDITQNAAASLETLEARKMLINWLSHQEVWGLQNLFCEYSET